MSKSDEQAMSRSERKKQNTNNKQPKKRGLWKKIFLGILGVVLAVVVAGAGLFTYYASNAPELTEEDLTGTYASDFVDMNGDVFYTLGGVEREFASAEDYPEVMKDAMIAIEDHRFPNHLGIDPIGIGRAAVGYVLNRGEIVGGGSTITQQLVKNSIFSTLQEDQTLERKAQEAWLALQLERELSKEEIITLYLNKIHMGGNVYGAATAAEEYYGKPVNELELHEAAMLAGMPRAPNYYNPYVDPEAAENRRNIVLNEMVKVEAITQEEADAAKEISVTEGLQEREEDSNTLVFDGYITAVLDEIEEKTDFNAYTAGLTIHTNYDPNAQELLYDVVNSDDYVNYPNEELQTAATLIDSTSGQITALIGGRNLEGQLSTNYATGLDRGVGSTLKPLTTYAPAIEFLQYSTYHQVNDAPYDLNGWTPRNYDNDFKGQMSMRDALVDSRNVPTAKIFNEDLENYQGEITEFLQSLGIDPDNLNSEPGLVPQNAINGTMSPIELAGAYQAFANSGDSIEPHTINSITTQDGEEINLTPETNTVMEDYTAYMVNDILKGVIPYYSDQLTIPGYTHAAKTGTTNFTAEEMANYNIPSDGVPDNWVVGYSPYYTMSVWVGYGQRLKEGNYLTFSDGSRSLARDVYRESISRLVEGLEQRDWQQPGSVVEHTIEDGSNPAQLAAPGSGNAITELFVRGNEPSQRAEREEAEDSEDSEEIDLAAPSGLSARYVSDTDSVSINWDAYELDSATDGSVEYVLTVNGQEQTVSSTEYLLENPPRNEVDISLAVRVGGQTGPAASIQIEVPVPNEDQESEDEEEPEDPEEENSDEENEEESPPEEEPDEPEESEESEEPEEEEPENQDEGNEEESSDNGDNNTNEEEDTPPNNEENGGNDDTEESDPPADDDQDENSDQ